MKPVRGCYFTGLGLASLVAASLSAGFAGSLGLSAPALAQPLNQFIGFGDSTIDSGWYRNASPNSTSAVFNSDFAIAVTQGGGEATTGPGLVSSQYLANMFGLTAIPANQPGGSNYATGGARNDASNVGVSGLNQGAVPTVDQIQNYLAANGGVANPNALYLISSGGNDITFAENHFSGAAQTSYITTAASEIVASIAALKAAGARYILVPNEPQSFDGGDAALGVLRTSYDNSVWGGLAAAGVNFVPVDFNAMIRAIVTSPLTFGITTVSSLTPACTEPAGVTSGWATMCSTTSTVSTLVSPDAAQTHLFADDEHLATAGQQILADYEYSLVVAPTEISYLAEAPVKTRAAVIDSIFNQIAISGQKRSTGSFNTWVTGNVSSLSLQSGAPGLPSDPGVPVSGTLGADYAMAPGWLVGAAVSAGTTTQSFELGGNFRQNEFAASLFTALTAGPVWADVVGSAGALRYNTNRIVPIGITLQANTSSTSGSNISLAGEAGYNFSTGLITHGPVAGLVLQRIFVGGFSETDAFASVGGFTALSFADQVRDSEVSELGYQASASFGAWRPFAKLTWDHEFANANRTVTTSLTSTVAPSYQMPAVWFGTDWAAGTLGVAVNVSSAVTAYATFDGQIGQSNVTNYGGEVGVNVALNAPATASRHTN